MKKNIVVVGCGYWGKNLVRNFYELDSLYGICDPDKLTAKSFSEKYSVKNLTFNEILNDSEVKGVVLSVPAAIHAELSIKAMMSGKHVFVEKPIAMNEAEGREMIEVAKKSKVNLMVGHLLQYHPVFNAIKDIVHNNQIGDLNYIYSNRLSFGKIRSEEDVIWSFAPHDISMILSLTKQKVRSIRTESLTYIQPGICDSSIMHMDFDRNLKAHISVSWVNPFKEQKLVVIGESGMLVFDDTQNWNNKLIRYNHEVNTNGGLINLDKSYGENILVEESEPLKNECMHFIDVVRNASKPLTDGEEGLRVLNILSAATESKNTNKKIKVKI